MKCLDCGKGYYIEKEIKIKNRKVTIEVCNKCGSDFS